MKNKTMQEMNEQYKNCPVQVNTYVVDGRTYRVHSHFIGDKDINDMMYRYQKLGKTDPKYSHHLWGNNTIKSILHNPIYIGNLALLRRTTVSYKNRKVINKDESDWIIVEHNHEPIISQDLWDKVCEIDASVSHGKNTKTGVVKPFSGLCYCDTCETKMKQTATVNSKRPVGYVCTLYGNFGKSHCTSHYITQKALEKVVLDDIQRQKRRG